MTTRLRPLFGAITLLLVVCLHVGAQQLPAPSPEPPASPTPTPETTRPLYGVQGVLVEGPSRKDASELMGRTQCNRIVNFQGAPRLVGRLVDIRITQALPHSLRGEVVLAAEAAPA